MGNFGAHQLKCKREEKQMMGAGESHFISASASYLSHGLISIQLSCEIFARSPPAEPGEVQRLSVVVRLGSGGGSV